MLMLVFLSLRTVLVMNLTYSEALVNQTGKLPTNFHIVVLATALSNLAECLLTAQPVATGSRRIKSSPFTALMESTKNYIEKRKQIRNNTERALEYHYRNAVK